MNKLLFIMQSHLSLPFIPLIFRALYCAIQILPINTYLLGHRKFSSWSCVTEAVIYYLILVRTSVLNLSRGINEFYS